MTELRPRVYPVQSPLRGTPVTDNTFTSAQSGAASTTATSRHPFTVAVDCTDLRLVYANWYNNVATASPNEIDVDNPNPITVSASIEIAGVKYRASFNGQTSVTIGSGGMVQSDPLPVDVTAGTVIYVWTYVLPTVSWYANAVSSTPTGSGGSSSLRTDTATVTSGSSTVTDTSIVSTDYGKPVSGTGIPANTYVGTVTAGASFLLSSTSGSQTSVNATGNGSSVSVGGDLTGTNISSATIPDATGKFQYVPSQICGTPLAPIGAAGSTPVALLVGDSLMGGSNDFSAATYSGRSTTTPALAGGGFTARALYGKIPYIQTAVSGDQAALFLGTSGHFRRWTWASAGTTMLCNYGRNDLSNGQTLAQIQANLLTIWTMGARRGQRVIQYTVTPYTTSTDGWTTTGNQANATGNQESVRVSLNTWIRAGAPVASALSLTPVAVGTAGALVAGQPGHPLYTYFEVADLVESARNSGVWATMPGRTITDGVMSMGSITLTSSTAAFTSADLGSIVTVAGAGTSGALLVTTVAGVSSGTSAQLATSASTAVSGATVKINVAGTKDGLHPSSPLAIVTSAAIVTSQIV